MQPPTTMGLISMSRRVTLNMESGCERWLWMSHMCSLSVISAVISVLAIMSAFDDSSATACFSSSLRRMFRV